MPYAAGDRFTCPACNTESFIEERRLMEGWEVVGRQRVCALCGCVLAEGGGQSGEGERENREGYSASEPARSAALAFLNDGDDGEKSSADILRDAAPRRFCRDCRNYVKHPFGSRCSAWDREVDPMQDCDRFEASSDSGDGEQE